MISLIIPPKDQVSRVNKMLADEYGTASNIKSRVNRLEMPVLTIKIHVNSNSTLVVFPIFSQTVCSWCNHIYTAKVETLHKST